jgi:hypothetical protein
VFRRAGLPAGLAGIAAVVLLTSACGSGEGSLELPSRTATGTERPTITRDAGGTAEPTSERTERETSEPEETETEESGSEETEEAAPTRDPEPTREPEPAESEDEEEPTREATREATVEVTVEATATAAAAGETGTTGDADDGVPPWVWWLLIAGVVALVAGAWFMQRRNTRLAWENAVQAATEDAEWIVRRLIPDLAAAPSPQQRALAWGAAAERVGMLEQGLAGLAATAPDPQAAARAGALGDAVRQAHGRVDRMVLAADETALAEQLWAVARDLDEAVAAARPAPSPASAPSGP